MFKVGDFFLNTDGLPCVIFDINEESVMYKPAKFRPNRENSFILNKPVFTDLVKRNRYYLLDAIGMLLYV